MLTFVCLNKSQIREIYMRIPRLQDCRLVSHIQLVYICLFCMCILLKKSHYSVTLIEASKTACSGPSEQVEKFLQWVFSVREYVQISL